MSWTPLQTIVCWVLCLRAGFGAARLMQMITDNLLAGIVLLVCLVIIVPCCFAPLFIDMDRFKDQRQQ